jgi:hypothetical protein
MVVGGRKHGLYIEYINKISKKLERIKKNSLLAQMTRLVIVKVVSINPPPRALPFVVVVVVEMWW